LMIAEGRKDREARAIEFDHTRVVREQKRELDLERQRVANLQELRNLDASGEIELQELILRGEIDKGSLLDGQKVNQAAVSTKVKEIELAIQQKESLLEIETDKAQADARFAVGQRQALFEQELKTLEAERIQNNRTTESQRDMAEMAELTRLQVDRQSARSKSDMEAAKQAADSSNETLKLRLDASAAAGAESQHTLRKIVDRNPDAVSPDVLKEMLKQDTYKVFSETGEKKMESLMQSSKTPEDPSSASKPVEKDEPETVTNDSKVEADKTEFTKGDSTVVTQCDSCSFPTQEGWTNCPKCGKELVLHCRNCAAVLDPEWNNCPECGLNLIQ